MSAIDETWETYPHYVICGRDTVCTMSRFSTGRAPSDSALIASAPDLVRALREICAAFLGSDIPRRAAAYEQAERALAKAGVDTAGIVALAREGAE